MSMGILATAFSCSDDGFKETEVIQDTNKFSVEPKRVQ